MAQRMTNLPQDLRERMLARRAARTDEGMQAMFGISYNTWRRIEAGEPIRVSVAARLVSRMKCLEESAGADE